MTTLRTSLLAALAAVMLGQPALAGRLVLEPVDALAAAVGESELTRVAARFDVVAIPAGAVIEMAYLEWSLGELGGEGAAVFVARAIEDTWSAEAESPAAPDVAAEAAAGWRIEPGGVAAEGGHVRLELTELVREWALGQRENLGVAIDTESLDGEAADAALGGARLVVHYGRR